MEIPEPEAVRAARGESETPKCPTGNHDMVWSDYSKGGYAKGFVCHECRGNPGKGSAPGPHRWFCEACHDDFCGNCKPAPK